MSAQLAFDVRRAILLTVAFLSTKSLAENPSNPCPSVFQYGRDGDTTFGLVIIRGMTYGETKLECELSNHGLDTNFAGNIRLTFENDKIYENIKSGNPFTYKIDFFNNAVPVVSAIRLNGVQLCSGPKHPAPSASITFSHTITAHAPAGETQPQQSPNIRSGLPFPTFNSRPSFNSNGPSFLRFTSNRSSPSSGATPSSGVFNIPNDLRDSFTRSTATNRPQSSYNFPNFSNRNAQEVQSNEKFSYHKDNPFFSPSYDHSRTFTQSPEPRVPFTFNLPTTTTTTTTTWKPFVFTLPTTTTTEKPYVFTQPETISRPFTPAESAAPSLHRENGQNTIEYINSICGQENFNFMVKNLAVHGRQVIRSRFPWVVAIFKKSKGALAFQCGGSLISSRTVISAAHCFYTDFDVIRDEDILISMGRHNLTDWTDTSIVHADVDRVIQHPDYRPELPKVDADLAIVLLKWSVPFTLAIRPICLWQGTIDLDDIVGWLGIVVGWGKDQHNDIATSPKLVNARVVSEITCITSNEKLIHLTSNRTICAGERDGSGPCEGDSGSGLMIKKSRKWMLRGTVSAALGSGVNQCNLDEYVVYTDIAKFIGWIHANMLV